MQAKEWLDQNDLNEDGKLNFKEFYRSLKKILKLKIEDDDDDSNDEEDNEETGE